MNDRLLCLDIETVPDRELIPADWDEGQFPKPIWHRVVAISFVEARIESDRATGSERYIVECCRTGGQADFHEKLLLQGYWKHFTASKARVVTWNGRGFDLPVLRTRAMMYGLSAQSWYKGGTNKFENYTYRFAPDWHCDLMEQLSDYKAAPSMKLEEVAAAIGLPGKIGGHGSEVEAMIQRGEIDNVRAYCECDCLNLFVLYVRWGLLSGKISAECHNDSIKSLVSCLEAEREERPHFGEFLDRWQASTQPVPMLVPEAKRFAEAALDEAQA